MATLFDLRRSALCALSGLVISFRFAFVFAQTWLRRRKLASYSRTTIKDKDNSTAQRVPKARKEKPLPEWLVVSSWNLYSPISAICVDRSAIVFGDRTGLVGALPKHGTPTVSAWFADQSGIPYGQNESSSFTLNPYISSRWWWRTHAEVIAIAKLDESTYVVVDESKVTVVGPLKAFVIDEFTGAISVAVTNGFILFGMPNAEVCVAALVNQNISRQIIRVDLHALGATGLSDADTVYEVDAYGQLGMACCGCSAVIFDLLNPSRGAAKVLLTGNRVNSVALSRSNGVAVTVTEDGACQAWDYDTATVRCVFDKHISSVYSLDLTEDGSLAATGSGGYDESDDYSVYVWSTIDGTALLHHRQHTGLVSSLSFSPRGAFLYTAGWDGVFTCIDLKFGDRTRFTSFASSVGNDLPTDVLKHVLDFLV